MWAIRFLELVEVGGAPTSSYVVAAKKAANWLLGFKEYDKDGDGRCVEEPINGPDDDLDGKTDEDPLELVCWDVDGYGLIMGEGTLKWSSQPHARGAGVQVANFTGG